MYYYLIRKRVTFYKNMCTGCLLASRSCFERLIKWKFQNKITLPYSLSTLYRSFAKSQIFFTRGLDNDESGVSEQNYLVGTFLNDKYLFF